MNRISYLAGIIDSKGSIHIVRKQPRTREGETSPYFFLQLSVGCARQSILDALQEQWGGTVQHVGYNHIWIVTGAKAEECLRAVFPHLSARKDQARLALDFRESVSGWEAKILTQKEVERREEMRRRMSALNRRQPPAGGRTQVLHKRWRRRDYESAARCRR